MSLTSRTLAWARTLVNIGYLIAAVCSVLFPLIALVPLLAPRLFAGGGWGLTIDAVGLKIGVASTLLTGPADRFVFSAAFLGGAVAFWGAFYILAQAKRLLTDIGTNPFSLPNAARINRIGVATIVAGLVGEGLRLSIGIYLANVLTVPGLTFRPALGFPFATVFLGLMVMVIAEVFRYGARLQEDNDLTV